MKRDASFESSQKICAIHNPRVVNSLSADATVCCSKCGARAHDPASLCSPVQITGSG
jgi:hypothetical protein